ncbi:MAG: hypothetical protein H0V43_06255 [Gemmatimonadales bacterium]|nr:hypothetical protein [Gemmatimonadales bacterium]
MRSTHTEDHKISDFKIAVGSLCCILALIAQFYPANFPDNRFVLIICAGAYLS